MKEKKIYLSGPITDNPNYKEKFKRKQKELESYGHVVFNPVKTEGFSYKDYIDMGLCELSHCDAIYLMDGYLNSPGAMLELEYARVTGLEIIDGQGE